MTSETEAIEQVRNDIKKLNQSVESLKDGPLTERALLILIQDATKPVGSKYNKKKVSVKTIKAVLNGISAMEEMFLNQTE